MAYTLYNADGITPLTTPQPTGATWESIPRGVYANGIQRIALGKKVVWTFGQPIGAAQYQQLVVARQSGRQQFVTWKRPEGAVAGSYVTVTGIMQETIPGVQTDGGDYTGVSVTFVDVREA